MAHIKKLVIQGFKSFARRTEIPFDQGINVIIGPNGSGKSNISDAICFVLGRLSVKSMRAEKTRNLIFMGSKYMRPAKEAFVELVFDNRDRAFAMDVDEIVIRRGVRINGQSIYKINDESKTRAEIIETLGQAGIDPYGYNLILQGQIQSIVKMHGEERRKIIGEVAGISVYEWRKEKSLKELEKTDSRLKEISTILRERTAFLNNLEKEKSQAQRHQELTLTVKRAKASILKKKHDEKIKEIESLVKTIEEKMNIKDKCQQKSLAAQQEIESLTEKINQINRHIREASGFEQGRLREEITNLKAELEGLRVRREGYERRSEEVDRRVAEMKKAIPELESDIRKLREESPLMAKKAVELKKKKEELAELEREKKQMLTLKSEINSLRDRIEDKRRQISRLAADSESLIRTIEELSANMVYKSDKSCIEAITNFKSSITKLEDKLDALREEEISHSKIVSVAESDIAHNHEIKKKIENLDVCPLCQSKMTESHVTHVNATSEEKIHAAQSRLALSKERIVAIQSERQSLKQRIAEEEKNLHAANRELSQHRSIHDRKETLKNHVSREAELKKELSELEAKRQSLESKSTQTTNIDERYENKMLEIEEISSRTVEDIDTTLLYKERELEKTRSIIARSMEDSKEIESHIESLETNIEENETMLAKKEEKEKELNARFEKMFSERDASQRKLQELNIRLTEMNSETRQIEEQINYLKIGKAKLDGERETIEMDLSEYAGVEIIQGSLNFLEEKLRKSQSALEEIGSINMRALEVYDSVKKEYDVVKEKVDTLNKEKEEILKVIEEIDKKKKKAFMKAYHAINTLFAENFSKLSSKGTANLEIENAEDMFAGGIDIVVKMSRGKYFDVASLSGGEQTLVALSLLFAIQEYKPYQFYILDEIDAALDKRNSERLAALLKQYMKAGQYIVITHNDAIILDSNVLYGVSMHEGVSKILSLRVGEETPAVQTNESEEIAIAPESSFQAESDLEMKDQ